MPCTNASWSRQVTRDPLRRQATSGCAGKTVKSLENTCHTWALLRWWFMKRCYIQSLHTDSSHSLNHSSILPLMALTHSWLFDQQGSLRLLRVFTCRPCLPSVMLTASLHHVMDPPWNVFWWIVSLHCVLSLAVQCIVISPVCGGQAGCMWVWVCLWVCYYDNSKLRASIFTKLGL